MYSKVYYVIVHLTIHGQSTNTAQSPIKLCVQTDTPTRDDGTSWWDSCTHIWTLWAASHYVHTNSHYAHICVYVFLYIHMYIYEYICVYIYFCSPNSDLCIACHSVYEIGLQMSVVCVYISAWCWMFFQSFYLCHCCNDAVLFFHLKFLHYKISYEIHYRLQYCA